MKRTVHGRYVAIYARVSTEDQVREGVSLQAQVARLQAYCEAMRPGEEVRVVVDEGESAKSLDRPALRGLLLDCKARRVSSIVVLKLDRLTRSVRDLADLLQLFERYNVALCSLSESLDTSTASGRLMLNLLASVSQWEREAIAERTAFALSYKRKNGDVYGPVPYGFKRDGKRLVQDDEQSEMLNQIRSMRAEGKSLRWIVAWLNEHSIRTPRGGVKWHVNSLCQILGSKAARELYAS